MKIDVIAVLPHLFSSFFETRIVKRARESGILNLRVFDLHDWGIGNYRQIDDKPYGGNGGMVIMPEPLANAIESLSSKRKYDEIIYMTCDGQKLNHELLIQLLNKDLLIICGHYKGIDYRIRQLYVTKEISIGDYVLSGGELAAAVLVDALIRLLPGVVNSYESITSDSFYMGLLEPPVYTVPRVFKGIAVPEVLLSGNHKAIEKWRLEQSIKRTKELRPDPYKKFIEKNPDSQTQ